MPNLGCALRGRVSCMEIETYEGTYPCNAPHCAFVPFNRVSNVDTRGMGSSHPFSVSINRCVSPSISNILTVLSEEHVANRRP